MRYCIAFLVLLIPLPALAGGALIVGGTSGFEGAIFKWQPGSTIHYRVDGGPMAFHVATTVVDNAAGIARVNSMFAAWSNVSTSSLQFQNDGGLVAGVNFTDGDVNTLDELDTVFNQCDANTETPVIFDGDGAMLQALNLPPDIIGFAGPCNSFIGSELRSGFVFMNGDFQDGLTQNDELSAAQFDEAIIHEIGHLLGLDHSQINVNVLNNPHDQCALDDRAGLPIMFPFAHCQARTSLGLPPISPDDEAWISFLYPNGSFTADYGFIEGHIYFADGITQVQGVNIVARAVDDPATVGVDESKRNAVSVVSGFLFADLYDVALGSPFGSRQAVHEGYFKIPVPHGDWMVSFESINSNFGAGSGVGPLFIPIQAPGTAAPVAVTVVAGSTVTLNVNLNTTVPRFDSFEDESWSVPPAPVRWQDEEVRA